MHATYSTRDFFVDLITLITFGHRHRLQVLGLMACSDSDSLLIFLNL
jgi:hypothetical protein